MNLDWGTRRNIENSLVEFLQDQATSVTVFYKGANESLDIRVGNAPQDDWKLPNISVYTDPKTAPRAFIGNNKRFESYLTIIDIRALDDGMRSDLADWVTSTINDGFDFYTYSPNSSDPTNPIKVLAGKISVDFVTDTPIRSVVDSSKFDKFRQNITLDLTIAV